MSGDTLQYLSLLAARHGMNWVSLGLLPGWNTTTSTDHDDNRLGFYLGAGAQSGNDRGPDAVLTGAPRVTSAAASHIPPTRSLPAEPFPQTPRLAAAGEDPELGQVAI